MTSVLVILFALLLPSQGQLQPMPPAPVIQPFIQPVATAPVERSSQEPIPNKVDGLELPPDTTVDINKRIVFVPALTTGAVNWMVYSATGLEVTWVENPGTKSISVFPNAYNDIIMVHAWTTVGTEPSKMARMIINVSKLQIQPGQKGQAPMKGFSPVISSNQSSLLPQPGQPPLPGGGGGSIPRYVSLIVDMGKLPTMPGVNEAINSAQLKKQLTDRGITVVVVAHNSTQLTNQKVIQAVQNLGGPPAVVVQDANYEVINAIRLTDINSVLAAIGGGL